MVKLFVISSYTPDSSSGYAWLGWGTSLVEAAALAGVESLSCDIVRLVAVQVPRKVRTWQEIQNFMDDLDANDGFDVLPAIWESKIT